MCKKISFWLMLGLMLVVFGSAGWANASPGMSFQGRLTDAGGAPITSATDVELKIFNDEFSGTMIWETDPSPTVTPNENGFFSVVLEGGSPQDFSDTLFNGDYWVEVTVDTGTGWVTLAPRQPLTTAPYAIALTAGDKTIEGRLSVYSVTGDAAYFGGNISIESATKYGVFSETSSSTGWGVYGFGFHGVHGFSDSVNGQGVYGTVTDTSGKNWAVYGENKNEGSGRGVYGRGYYGVFGYSPSDDGTGVLGKGETGVYGEGSNRGVVGEATFGHGVYGFAEGSGIGVYAYNSGNGTGLLVDQNVRGVQEVAHFYGDVSIQAGGDLNVAGNIYKGGGGFMIDHPLDPANKILRHSFVESPKMLNVYDGKATLDSKGEVTVNLPNYFKNINKNFRYQLTPIGKPAPNLYIKSEIEGNSFVIAGGVPGMKVSWQVTAERNDLFARKHPVIVEESKSEKTRVKPGEYIHPELYGQPERRPKIREEVGKKTTKEESID